MNMFLHMNSVALVVAVVVYFAIGGIWFSALMGKRLVFLPNAKMSEADRRNVGKMFTMSFMTNIVIFLATAYMVSLVRPMDVAGTMRLGVSLGVGFMAAPFAMNYLDGRKPLKFTIIDAGYHVVGIIVITLILGLWK